MKSQPIKKNVPDKKTVVISNKTPNMLPPPKVPPGVTLRTVHFIEIGDLAPGNVQLMVQELNATYNPAEQGIHFVIPLRHGKIGADIVFEDEFLSVVNKVCEISDGKIVLKGGARKIQVMRVKI
jgi:23S rRNA-/tRNA-specific pseudouridylate synthase